MNNVNNPRRNFLKKNALTGMGLIMTAGLGNYAYGRLSSPHLNPESSSESAIMDTGDMNLKQLRDRYHSDLFDHFLPNMDNW